MKKNRWVVGSAAMLLAAMALAVLLGLSRLSHADSDIAPLLLSPTAQDDHGWTFETEAGPAQPEFGFGGYFAGVPAQTDGAVAASITLPELGKRTLLEFGYAQMGIQVFVDNTLLYTDFPQADNAPDAFLQNVQTAELTQKALHLILPEDSAGKTLRIVSYSASLDGLRLATFPTLVSQFSDAAILTTDSVRVIAAATALSLLAVFLLLILFLSAWEGTANGKLLPLAVYFLLAAVHLVSRSFLADAAGLHPNQLPLSWIKLVYIDCLLVFLALEMRHWKRWTLLAASALHAAATLVRLLSADVPPQGDTLGFVLVLLALALLLVSRKENRLFRLEAVCMSGVAVFLLAIWGITQFWGLEHLYGLANPVDALLSGDFRAFYGILCAVAGGVSAVWVIAAFVRDALHRQRQTHMLRLREDLARENYAKAQTALDRTATLRHEWKNQIAVLHLLQQKGDLAGLERRLTELDHRLDTLVPQQYSKHFAINTLLQSAASRAEELGVVFHANASVPPDLRLNEDDLCTMLLNLLDNALEAAAQVEPPQPREVICTMHVNQGYLAIQCENTYAEPLVLDETGALKTTKPHPESHGFGVAQMKAIAQRHNSVLDIHYTDQRFTVRTALSLDGTE